MKFLADEMKTQLATCHPELNSVLHEFEAWSDDHAFPEPFIVDLVRTKREQGLTYFKIWRDDAVKTLSNAWASAGAKLHAQNVLEMPDPDLIALAEKRFSWHVVRAAADLRTHHYSPAQFAEVDAWFRQRCRAPMWELKLEPHGTGPHVHLGRRDYSWRKRMEAQNA